MDNYEWSNYRCRKCGGLISRKSAFNAYSTNRGGLLIRGDKHKCSIGIEEGEAVLADFVSVSHQPLKDAEVIE